MLRTSHPLVTGFLIALSLLVAGCSNSVTDTDGRPESSDDVAAVPDFTGPYAADFAASYQSAESDFVRQALADEEISDAEYAEMTELFRQCLADVGITFNGFDSTGAYSTSLAPNEDDTYDLVASCVTSSGQDALGLLRDIITVNPENLDTTAIMAECLVREGVVPPDYGADDYVADATSRFADTENMPEELSDAFIMCSNDPLGVG